jgi:hypothetical protein
LFGGAVINGDTDQEMRCRAFIVRFTLGAATMAAAGVGASGCTAPSGPRTVGDPDPGVKIPAIKTAVDRHDLSAARQLVADLQNDDPAVRFYAISGLYRLTGQNFGYVYYDDEATRLPAVRRWQKWLADQEKQ